MYTLIPEAHVFSYQLHTLRPTNTGNKDVKTLLTLLRVRLTLTVSIVSCWGEKNCQNDSRIVIWCSRWQFSEKSNTESTSYSTMSSNIIIKNDIISKVQVIKDCTDHPEHRVYYKAINHNKLFCLCHFSFTQLDESYVSY